MKESDMLMMRDIMRQWEQNLVDALGPLDDDLEEFYDSVPLPDGHSAVTKIVRPRLVLRPNSSFPLIVLFQGGGFAAGSVDMVTRPARDFAKQFGAVVVSATHRLVPEHRFPVPVQDAWDTLVWLVMNAPPKYGAQLDRGFVIGGFSSGATIAAVLLQQAHDRGFCPPLTAAFISIPLLLVDEIVPAKYRAEWTSRDENTQDPATSKETVKQILGHLNPDIYSPLFSPFNAQNPHKGLPRTYIQVCGRDPLRDDGLVYERALRENGVETRLNNYPELTHAAWTIFADDSSPKDLGMNTLSAMAWLLRRD